MDGLSKLLSKSTKPADASTMIKTIQDAIMQVASSDKNKPIDKIQDDIAKALASMKVVLYGSQDRPVDEDAAQKLCDECIAQDLMPLLLTNLSKYQFESKKDVASIFNNLLRKKFVDSDNVEKFPFCDYLAQRPEIVELLISGYETVDIALACGSMLRECVRYESLTSIVLSSEKFWSFFGYVEVSVFDVSSDALATFRELLTKHRPLVAKFLADNYERFFGAYQNLLKSQNYVTRRQSVKLLGEVLVHRSNFNVMSKYISKREYLMLMMNLLRDKSKTIQHEAFHVFKVFVANPNKPADIVDILVRNRDRLIAFLKGFRTDIDDEQFVREKEYLIKEIGQLSSPASAPPAAQQ